LFRCRVQHFQEAFQRGDRGVVFKRSRML
jgi:hypothetical protein